MSKDNIVEVMVALGEAYDLQPRFLTSNNFVLPYTTKISGPEKSLENANLLKICLWTHLQRKSDR